MSGISTTEPLPDATALCKEHGGLFITAGTDNVWDKALGCYRYPRSWKVWRKMPGGRAAYCGGTRDPRALLRLVRKLIQGG